MKKILALILVGAASCDSDVATSSPEFTTTTAPPAPVTDGPKLDNLDSFWFETTDPDGNVYHCLYVGWYEDDYWAEEMPSGAMGLHCHPEQDQTNP